MHTFASRGWGRRALLWLPVAALLGAHAGCGSSSPTPTSTTFRIVNVGSRTLYLQASGMSGTQEFLALARGGEAVRFTGDCAICECAGCPSCAICGRALASVQALQPGEAHDVAWDGMEWVVESRGCREDLDCERPQALPAGELDVTVTYSDSFTVDTTFGAQDELIGTRLTASLSYRHPAGAPVVVEVQ